MTDQITTVLDPEAELRWRAWQTRGAESDRRTARAMRIVMLVVVAFLAAWLIVVLA
jgi:hypothetical protein